MARRLRRALCVGVAVSFLSCCALPAAAPAVTIGMPDLNPATGSGLLCSLNPDTPCSWVQMNPAYEVPFDGLITRWRVRVLTKTGTAQLRIVRPQGATVLWGTSSNNEIVFAPGIQAFETHLPVSRGEVIGITSQDVDVLIQDASGPFILVWRPPAANGASPPPTGSADNFLLGMNADVERDADGDMLGDETQDSDDDNDTIPDSSDNCPTTAGASQADNDADGTGDLCDADDDNDGLPDSVELQLGSNPSNADTDADGTLDGSDRCLLYAGAGGCPAAARLALQGKRRLTRRAFTGGVKITVTPDQPVALRLLLVASRRGGATILAERSLPLAPGARSVRLKPSRRAAKGVKRAQLRVLAINVTGAQTELRRTIRITR